MSAVAEPILWDNRKTCVISMNKQGGTVWTALRKGRGTMSYAAAMSGHIRPDLFTRFYTSKEELAKVIVGTSSKSFDPESASLMAHGVVAEPIIRTWYSEKIVKAPIAEVGLAIWKEDPRFGGSLDGEFTSFVGEGDSKVAVEEGIEIKAPNKMYWKLVDHAEAIKKGFTPEPGYHSHVFDSHYDQFMGNGVITGKKFMHYVVVANDGKGTAYHQVFPVDPDYWSKDLYPAMSRFYDDYVAPEMSRAGVLRIDPPTFDTL